MGKTIEVFENRGKVALKRDEHDRVWPADFLDFVRRERIFATLLTPPATGMTTAAGTLTGSVSSARS